MTAYDAIAARLAAVTGQPPTAAGKARCPVHDDRKASLSIARGRDRVLIKCHAGCDTDAILSALDMSAADLFDERRPQGDDWTPCGHGIATEYRYLNETGELLYTVVRCPRKDFAQWRPDPTTKTGRRWKLGDTRRVLYRLPEVLAAAKNGDTIWITEGEKDADRLAALGKPATCNPHGAGKWRDEYAQALTGAECIIVADRDDPGRNHAATVAASISRAGGKAFIVEPAAGKDITDHLDTGLSLDDVVYLDAGDTLAGEPDTAPPTPAADLEWLTGREKLRLQARSAAQAALRAEANAAIPMPDLVGLDTLLTEPREEVRYRVDLLWPRHGRVVLAAQYKAGKTTLRDNLIRCLVDGTLFLDRFDTVPVTDGTVVIIDNEMSRADLRRWLGDQNIGHPHRVKVVALRGAIASFDILDTQRRAQWAEQLRAVQARVVILDCLAPLLAVLGLEENTDIGVFLVAFEALLAEADVDEAVVVHHMGHDAERSRGHSRLRDWPDAEWKLVRERIDDEERDADPTARRYFSAIGRNVALHETLLLFDEKDRHLALGNGDRRQTAAERFLPQIVEYIRAHPGESQNAVVKGVADEVPDKKARMAITVAKKRGMIGVRRVGKAQLHYVNDGTEPVDPEPSDGQEALWTE